MELGKCFLKRIGRMTPLQKVAVMLVIGLVIGCWLAWHWVSREDRKIREDKGDKETQADKEDKNE